MNIFFRSILFCFILFLANCREKPKPLSETAVVADTLSTSPPIQNDRDADYEEDEYLFDTSFPVSVNGKSYRLLLKQDEFRSTKEPNASTTTVRVVDTSNDTLFRQVLEFNSFGQIRTMGHNCCWLPLINCGGGSGYSGILYKINFGESITLQPVLHFDELSYWVINNEGNSVLYFNGIWDMISSENDDDFESHFEAHKQVVQLFDIGADKVVQIEIGVTKGKYDFSDGDNVLQLMKSEPEIAAKIPWQDYNFDVIFSNNLNQ
jgi:hypothetical protein